MLPPSAPLAGPQAALGPAGYPAAQATAQCSQPAINMQACAPQGYPANAMPVAPTHTKIDVLQSGTCLTDSKRVYNFALVVGGVQVHVVTGSYSQLRDRCSKVFLSGDFPSKHVFRDYTNNESNVAERAQELQKYLHLQLNTHDEGSVVGSQRTFQALGVASPGAAQALTSVAVARKEAANAARNAEAQRQAAICAQQQADCQHAQEFNTIVAYSNIPIGQLTTITYPQQQRFELRNRWWGWGDAHIKGAGDLSWFQLRRTNPSLFGEMFKNAQFTICTARGEPLLLMQEQFRWASYEYLLYRIDPRNPREPIQVCRVIREWGNNFLRITDQYDVHLSPAMAGVGSIQCQGRWPNQFTISNNGRPVATIDKQLFSWTDKYHILIAPHNDLLLFIGIACAIDRIHHEVEDKRRR